VAGGRGVIVKLTIGFAFVAVCWLVLAYSFITISGNLAR
jgi:hypothetical protein